MDKSKQKRTAYIFIKENETAYVDPNMPPIMNALMSEEEWELFCADIDEALVPANKFKRRQRVLFPMVIISVISLLINIGYNFWAGSFYPWDDEIEIDNGDFILICHACLTVVFTLPYLIFIFAWKISKRGVRQQVSSVCKELVEQKPALKIRLIDHLFMKKSRHISWYIEVKVLGRKVVSGLSLPKSDDTDDEESETEC